MGKGGKGRKGEERGKKRGCGGTGGAQKVVCPAGRLALGGPDCDVQILAFWLETAYSRPFLGSFLGVFFPYDVADHPDP